MCDRKDRKDCGTLTLLPIRILVTRGLLYTFVLLNSLQELYEILEIETLPVLIFRQRWGHSGLWTKYQFFDERDLGIAPTNDPRWIAILIEKPDDQIVVKREET